MGIAMEIVVPIAGRRVRRAAHWTVSPSTLRDSLDQDLLEGPMECRSSSQANSLGGAEKSPFNQLSGCWIYTVGHNFVECCLNKACFCWSMNTYHRCTVAFYFVSFFCFFVQAVLSQTILKCRNNRGIKISKYQECLLWILWRLRLPLLHSTGGRCLRSHFALGSITSSYLLC